MVNLLYDIFMHNAPYNTRLNYKMIELLMQKWEKNKKHIKSDLFGGQLIVSKKINIEPDDETIVNFWNEFKNFLLYHSTNSEQKHIINSIEAQEFYNNKLLKTIGEHKKGMRLTKLINKLYQDKGVKVFLINKYSMILQDLQISGKLCLSIHPLDYLTISENASNWTSCHSFDGSYVAGNLSYMTDTSTVVAYLCSDKLTQLSCLPDNIKWNNKKWRVLIHLNNNLDTVVINKQYPYFNNQLIKILKETYFKDWYIDKFDNHTAAKYTTPYTVKMTNIGADASLFYNDLKYSSQPFITYIMHKNQNIEQNNIMIGNCVPCLNCGCELDITDGLVCSYCNDDYTHCDECGIPIPYNEVHYLSDGTYCESCYDFIIEHCAICGKPIHPHRDSYKIENREFICLDCYINNEGDVVEDENN